MKEDTWPVSLKISLIWANDPLANGSGRKPGARVTNRALVKDISEVQGGVVKEGGQSEHFVIFSEVVVKRKNITKKKQNSD